MAKTLRIVGIAWMTVCGLLWLWLGFAQPFGQATDYGWPRWLMSTALTESQFGLTLIALMLAGVGYFIYRAGSDT